MTASGSGKYIGFGLRIETGAERTTIVDIFNITCRLPTASVFSNNTANHAPNSFDQ